MCRHPSIAEAGEDPAATISANVTMGKNDFMSPSRPHGTLQVWTISNPSFLAFTP
jgi:hypothetical protein